MSRGQGIIAWLFPQWACRRDFRRAMLHALTPNNSTQTNLDLSPFIDFLPPIFEQLTTLSRHLRDDGSTAIRLPGGILLPVSSTNSRRYVLGLCVSIASVLSSSKSDEDLDPSLYSTLEELIYRFIPAIYYDELDYVLSMMQVGSKQRYKNLFSIETLFPEVREDNDDAMAILIQLLSQEVPKWISRLYLSENRTYETMQSRQYPVMTLDAILFQRDSFLLRAYKEAVHDIESKLIPNLLHSLQTSLKESHSVRMNLIHQLYQTYYRVLEHYLPEGVVSTIITSQKQLFCDYLNGALGSSLVVSQIAISHQGKLGIKNLDSRSLELLDNFFTDRGNILGLSHYKAIPLTKQKLPDGKIQLELGEAFFFPLLDSIKSLVLEEHIIRESVANILFTFGSIEDHEACVRLVFNDKEDVSITLKDPSRGYMFYEKYIAQTSLISKESISIKDQQDGGVMIRMKLSSSDCRIIAERIIKEQHIQLQQYEHELAQEMLKGWFRKDAAAISKIQQHIAVTKRMLSEKSHTDISSKEALLFALPLEEQALLSVSRSHTRPDEKLLKLPSIVRKDLMTQLLPQILMRLPTSSEGEYSKKDAMVAFLSELLRTRDLAYEALKKEIYEHDVVPFLVDSILAQCHVDASPGSLSYDPWKYPFTKADLFSKNGSSYVITLSQIRKRAKEHFVALYSILANRSREWQLLQEQARGKKKLRHIA